MIKFQIYIQLLLVCLLTGFSASGSTHEERSDCQGKEGEVTVELKNYCMCIGKDNCFSIGLGKDGPEMTSSGSGKLSGCKGDKYTAKTPGQEGYDNDCFATGIAANDQVGKWLHKPKGCAPVSKGLKASKGCILVPCSKWMDLHKIVDGKQTMIKISGSKEGAAGTAHMQGYGKGKNSAEGDDDHDYSKKPAKPNGSVR